MHQDVYGEGFGFDGAPRWTCDAARYAAFVPRTPWFLSTLDPNVMACVVCDGLKCMHVCPSGALVPIPLGEINMGTAVWNYETCVRSHGENCTICIDQCPIGTVAIELRANMVHVHESGCTGCGVCQQQCPTSPKSIRTPAEKT